MERRRREGGFTLIELLVVIAILAVLAAILIPNFMRSRATAQLAACQLNLRNIAAALDIYFNENQIYPAASGWQTTLESGGYIRAVPVSPVDRAQYGYQTNGAQSNYVLWDGPNKYVLAGVTGYVVYTPTGGNQIGVPAIPTP
ncbi:MAG TPA: type II secretion system protein [bacterium]|nr:type II secretion system protein [bacterium]